MDKKKVILDCDTGIDDAFAIMLAAQHLDLLGVTTIGGNVTLDNVTRNSIQILELIGKADEISVYPGHAGPMVIPLKTASDVHGSTGLGDVVLPAPTHEPKDEHAVDFIVDTIMSTDDVTLIATGPLTNVATAINREPRIVERVTEIDIMGGSVTMGNSSPAAEFNIWVDPEAAHRVFNSGAHIKMVGLNLTRQCAFGTEDVEKLRSIGTHTAAVAADLVNFYCKHSGRTGCAPCGHLHDACTAAWVIDPDIIKAAPMHVDVELNGTLTRGMTVCDYRHHSGADPHVDIEREPQGDFRGEEPNAEVALELDFPAFYDLLSKTLAAYE